MSATIEDRLGAALEARAELVTSDDLRPLAVPDRPAHGRRRTVLVVSAAAAGVVAITAPFVIARLASSHPDGGPIGPLPTPPSATQASEQPTDAGDVIARQQADVDGDGRPDDVRVVVTARRGGGSEGVVEVTLASGDTGSASWPTGYPPSLLPAFAINGDGHEQVLLSFTAGGDEAPLLVYTWLDDGLVHARNDSKAPLALGLDGEGTYADYYRQDGVLYSWLRGDPVDPGGWPMFTVDQWSWSVDGNRLIATPAGSACVDATRQKPPGPCA